MERLKHLERERVRLEYERERQMERFQREKDLEPRRKRHDRSPGQHKMKRSRYPVDPTTGHHSHKPDRHRKREARGYKEDLYKLSPSPPQPPSSKETKRSKESSHNTIAMDHQHQHLIRDTSTTTDDNTGNTIDYSDEYNDEENEFNTIEVNIRDEADDDEDDDDDDDEKDDGGGGDNDGGGGGDNDYGGGAGNDGGGGVEEGELPVEKREDDGYVNPFKMAKSKFDEDDEEEEIEKKKKKDKSASNSARKSDGSVEKEMKEEDSENGNESDHENIMIKDEETIKESDKRTTTPPSPPSPPSPDSPKLIDSPSTQLPSFFPAIQGCRNVEEFHCLNRVEEGTYGVVYRAVDRKTQDIVALKRLKMEKESEGFPITSLREINTLLTCTHENVVRIREVVVGSNMDKIYLVMDFVEHDLKSLMEYMKEPFLIGEVKTLMMQLLSGIAHLHDNWVVHRDLKTSNLLLSNQGVLKIGDFGLAREYGSPLKPYTPIVVTLWYRAPELLLGQKIYSTPIDIWSAGCIFAELVLKKPLFAGRSELDQLNKIFKELGTPNEKIWPGVTQLAGFKTLCFNEHHFNKLSHKFDKHMSARGFELLNSLLTYCPEKRLTAEEAFKDAFFTEVPIPVESAMFPTWPSKSELRQGKLKIERTPKAPSGGEAYAKLVAEEEQVTTGFQLKSNQKPTGFSLRF